MFFVKSTKLIHQFKMKDVLKYCRRTTLIKLICRLYHPTSDDILINGYNIFDKERIILHMGGIKI